MEDSGVEEQWKLRVIHLLREREPQTPSAIGMLVKREQGVRKVQTVLLADARFVRTKGDEFWLSAHVCKEENTHKKRKKAATTPTTKKPKQLPPFHPQATAFQPPDTCWEAVLANHQPTLTVVLTEWRWLWLLPQVCRAFRRGLQPELCVRSMCAADGQPVIWKSKANDLFALSRADLAGIESVVVRGAGWMRFKETHLMRRDTVLQLALAKHGGTYAAINGAFLKRAGAKERRKKGRQ
jgi:hypothetical protein